MICQKYVVFAASVPGEYDATVIVVPVEGGGLVVPNLIEKLLAPTDVQVNAGAVPTPAAPLPGDGLLGAVGGCDPAAGVENDWVDEDAVMFANVRETTFQ